MNKYEVSFIVYVEAENKNKALKNAEDITEIGNYDVFEIKENIEEK